MDFLNHMEGGTVFYQILLLSPLQCTVNELQKLCEFEELSQGKAVEVTVDGKEENS